MAKTTPSKVKKTKKKDKSGKKKKRKLDEEATTPKKKKAKVAKDGSAKKKKKKKLTKKAGAETPKEKKKKKKKAKTPDATSSGKKRKAKTADGKSSVKKKKKKKGKKADSAKKKKKVKKVKKEEEETPAEPAEEKAEEEAAAPAPAPAPAAAPAAADDGANVKLFLGNLSYDMTDEIIKEFFKDCGTITDVFWLEDKTDGRFLGRGFVTFETLDQARLARAKKDEEVMGRAILIDYARPRADGSTGGGKQREARPLSERPEGCTTVFLGNLDFNIEEDDVKKFAKDCGEIASIRWLTHRDTGDFKGCGFCEFTTSEAVDKFVKLNGQKLNGRAIRIDYAQSKSKGGGGGGKREPRPLSEKPDGCTTVFCGNLSFDITEDAIHELAKACDITDGVKNIRWLTDRETQEFKGCGFIEFHDTESVDKFVAKNGKDVMGRSIRIDYAKPRPPREY